jgi:hypothetical protein
LVVDNARVPNDNFRDLLRRAKTLEKQLAYFGVVVRKCSFDEAIPSAERAGFTLVASNAANKEAVLEWPAEPDFFFSVSFEDPAMISIVAESRGDIYGLNLVTHSGMEEFSVELKPWLGMDQFGRNTLQFRDVLLSLPQFIETPAWASASVSFPESC